MEINLQIVFINSYFPANTANGPLLVLMETKEPNEFLVSVI